MPGAMSSRPFPYRRVNVVGTSSTGKTTFARALAARLGIPHVELDSLYWGPGWTGASPDAMRDRVAAAAEPDAWVIDGNYSVSRDIVWGRAQAIVWLDYPLRTILRRYAARTMRRARAREEIWPGTGNREKLSLRLLGQDGLLWWILSTYRRRRSEYRLLLERHPQLVALRFRSPAEADAWLAALDTQAG